MRPRRVRKKRNHLWLTAVCAVSILSCQPEDVQEGTGNTPGLLSHPVLSSSLAPTGSRISVAVDAVPPSGFELGTIDGQLEFDPQKLAFVGQEAGDSLVFPIVMVNDDDVLDGRLRIASIDPSGLAPRTAVLVFDVLQPGYADQLRYTADLAATTDLTIVPSGEESPASTDTSMATPLRSSRMSAEAWSALIATQPSTQAASMSGMRRFGDVDGNGTIGIVDVLEVTSWSIGLRFPPNSALPVPGDSAELAGNTRPANVPGLGEPGDSRGPGWDGCVRKWDVLDALALALEGIGVNVPIVGEPIPAGVFDPSAHTPRVPAGCTSGQGVQLSVLLEAGVVATSPLRDSTYQTGTIIPYSFAPAPGYTNVRVLLDTTFVPTSGSITLSRPMILVASADRLVTVHPGDEGLLANARSLLSASDPVAAYQTYLDQLVAFRATVPTSEAESRLAAIHYLAFDPIADSVALRRLDQALAGHEFVLGGSPGGAIRQTGPTQIGALVVSEEATTLRFVNGIFNDIIDNARGSTALRALALERGPFNLGPSFRYTYFYNRTDADQDETAEERATRCRNSLAVRGEYLSTTSGADFLLRCMYNRIEPTPGTTQWWDLVEAVIQLAQTNDSRSPSAIDVSDLTEDIQSQDRVAGRHSINFGHSQGALMVQNAFANLQNSFDYSVTRDSICPGAVSVASPTSENWTIPQQYVKGFVLNGDLVADRPSNSYPRMDNDTTLAYAAILALMRDMNIRNPSPVGTALYAFATIKYAVQTHLLIPSYLTPGQTRSAIQDSLASLYRECVVGSMEAAFPGETVFPGQGRNLNLYTRVLNQNGRQIYGRALHWSSDNPTVASVDSSGRVTALRDGTAVITATGPGGRAATFAYTVVPVPDVGLTGSWTGTWTDFTGGGSASFTLQQTGTNVTGTVTYLVNGTPYSVPIEDGRVSLGGVNPTVHFFTAAADYNEQFHSIGYQMEFHLTLQGANLTGSSPVLFFGSPTLTSRNWSMSR